MFEFDNKQIQGTAMGTKLAPAYANVFMGRLEHSIISHASFKPTFYRCFIDDTLMLWLQSELELKNSFIT